MNLDKLKQDLAEAENTYQQEIGKLKREHQDRVEQWKMNFLCLKDCQFHISEFRLLVIVNWKLKFLLRLFGDSPISDFRYFRDQKPVIQFFVDFHVSDSQHFGYWKFRIHQIISTKTLI